MKKEKFDDLRAKYMLKKGKTPVQRKKRTIELSKTFELQQMSHFEQNKYSTSLYESQAKPVFKEYAPKRVFVEPLMDDLICNAETHY